MQQRQLMLKRQRDLLTKRAHPGLLGGNVQQNQLHQRKTSDWSKFVMDQSLFQPVAASCDASPAARSDDPVAAASVADASPAAIVEQRPMTGDSTATVHFDSIPSAPTAVAGQGIRGEFPAESRSPSPKRMQAVSSSPAPVERPVAPGPDHGWDLQVGAPEPSQAGPKDQGRGGGRNFWRPWGGRGGGVSITTDEPTVVSNFAGGGGDALEDFGMGKRKTVDSRVVTPWQQAAGNGALDGLEEISVLPGALGEDVGQRAPVAMRRPARDHSSPQGLQKNPFSEDDIFGEVQTMELEN